MKTQEACVGGSIGREGKAGKQQREGKTCGETKLCYIGSSMSTQQLPNPTISPAH